MVDEKVILQETADVFAKVLAGNAPDKVVLYRHQDEAIRQVCANKSLVVSTGTGSGKTECFLIPIIDYLLRLSKDGNLSDSVHVMILYPMNALVNDQLARLREILKDLTSIRFGKYTGELASVSYEENIYIPEEVVQLLNENTTNSPSAKGLGFDRNLALPNEITRRSEWRKHPGHILVTNYSMLEYLLLRPKDSSLFGDKWRFIILDEAHCYNGAMGTEISWLIRRLTNRVVEAGSKRERMQYIATSATLISQKDLKLEERATFVKEQFASKIFPIVTNNIHYQEGYVCAYQPPAGCLNWDIDADTNIFDKLSQTTIPDELKNKYNDILIPRDDSLFAWMKETTERLEWLEKQVSLKIHYDVLRGGETVGVSDIDFLFQNLKAIVSLWKIKGDLRVRGKETFTILRKLAVCCGAFEDESIWADVLNDPLSPQKYGSTSDGKRYRIGNKAILTKDWAVDVEELSFESFHYLLKAAQHAVTNSDRFDELEIDCLLVSLSESSHNILDEYQKRLLYQKQHFETLRKDLAQYFSTLSSYLSELSIDIPLSSLIALTIAKHPAVFNLHAVMAEMLTAANQSKDSLSLSVLHKKLQGFSSDNIEKLINFLDWCCFARQNGSRHPVLDLRYHQLVRGLSSLGINLLENNVLCNPKEIGKPGVFSLGVCRNCGQPYILGFLKKRNQNRYPADQRAILSPFKTSEQKFMIALCWEQYKIIDDDITNQEKKKQIERNALSCYICPETGKIYSEGESYIPENAIPVKLLQPHEQNDTFISGCIRCGGFHTRPKENEYGLVSPVVFEATSAKITILDELARLVDPSTDPIAYNNPGKGRKVLAFSDSRSGASRFAYHFHVDFLSTNGKRFLREGIDSVLKSSNEMRAWHTISEESRNTYMGNNDVWPVLMKAAISKIDEKRVSLNELCDAFINRVEHYNLPDSFSVLGDDRNELSSKESVRFSIWNLICDKSRNSAINQGLINISVNYSVPPNLQKQTKLNNKEECRQMIDESISHWIVRKKVSRGKNWPMLEKVYGGNDPYLMSDKTQFAAGVNSVLNKRIRNLCNCDEDDAKNILETIWNQIFLKQKLIIPGGGNHGFWFDFSKIQFMLGTKALKRDTPSDDYFVEKYSRELIPVRVEEHTAQLSKERGLSYQKGFSQGRVNVLSCSTTFEMGIDVGDLSAVFLTNLPPNVSSYKQRAGRAGRRAGAAAYVLTYVTSRPFDEYYWDNPEQLYMVFPAS
ncbi:MAG: DEAD/DEAH box helicase [Bacteroidales bacterium]|nr:DEAD/DEAH box helicase [Bacteroidales bacterium]